MNTTDVTVKDIDIKFTSMITLMVKAAIAAIPAVIILALIFASSVMLFMAAIAPLPGGA